MWFHHKHQLADISRREEILSKCVSCQRLLSLYETNSNQHISTTSCFFGFLRCGRHFKIWKKQFLHPHQICLDAFLCLRPPHLSEFDDFSGTDGKPLESLCNIRHWPLRCSALFGPEKLLVVLFEGLPYSFSLRHSLLAVRQCTFPFLRLCPVRPLYPAPEASRTADVGELRQSARELASFFFENRKKKT